MTTISEIDSQIELQDIQPYLNGNSGCDLPESFVEQFRIAMMMLPPTAHKYDMKDVRTMSRKKPDEISVRELGMMLNVIFAIPFAQMYATLEEGIDKTVVFEKIKDEYNQKTGAFERKMQAKRNRLLKLSGVGDHTVPFNGLSKS